MLTSFRVVHLFEALPTLEPGEGLRGGLRGAPWADHYEG